MSSRRDASVILGALSEGSMAVAAPALAIASLTLAVNLVIDNLPGRSARNGVK